MKSLASAVGACLLAGCALKLPEIPRTHPANAAAPTGQIYATPAVLEVLPIIRPSDYPSSQPSREPEHDRHAASESKAGSKSQQQMQKEGQLHAQP